MEDVTVWFNPDCSKCVTAQGLLENEQNAQVTYIDYRQHPPTEQQLLSVLEKLGFRHPHELARKNEPEWGALELGGADDSTVLAAMVKHPILIQRPIVVIGDRAVIARPPELLHELLAGASGTEPAAE